MDRCQHCRAATVLSEALADAACRPYSSNEESAARYLHVFGLDQLDLLGDRPCADRFWFQSPRYLRAMALLENTQKAGRGDPGIDTAPPNRNRALKQGECRRGFKVSLAPIEHPRFGQMRLICAKSLLTGRAPAPYNEPCVGCCGARMGWKARPLFEGVDVRPVAAASVSRTCSSTACGD